MIPFRKLFLFVITGSCLIIARDNSKPSDTFSSDETAVLSATAQKKAPLTYLDTLNKGHELGISNPDKVAPESKTNTDVKPVASTPLSPSPVTTAPVTTVSGFRVQCYALTQHAKAAEKERLLKNSISGTKVYTITESSLFKVMVGDFSTREQADSMTVKLKHMGFWDAFIVTAPINSQ